MKDIHCSGLARPMICAGYVFLDLPRSPSNPAAEEGTAAGEYLERMLTGQPLGDVASNGYYFDDDMKFYTTPIYTDVASRASSSIMCEHKINWQTRSGVWIKGKPDIAFVDAEGRLCIEDLKYGFGLVEVKENWQLIAYAIGEVLRRGVVFNEISLKIHQPRAHHEDGPKREWVISYNQLLEYKERIEKRMDDLVAGKRDLQTSDKCKYCMGAAEACPAFNRLFYRSLEVSTEFVQDSITDEEVATQLDQVKRAKEAIRIKEDSITELANIRIKAGCIIPGYMQTESYTNRAWKKGFGPESIKAITGIDVIEKKFLSPAKAEKLGISKDFVAMLTERHSKGYSLKKQDSKELGNKVFGTINPKGE